jgi:hypothetical protein
VPAGVQGETATPVGIQTRALHEMRVESMYGRPLVARYVCSTCALVCGCGALCSKAQLERMKERFGIAACWPCAVAMDHKRRRQQQEHERREERKKSRFQIIG